MALTVTHAKNVAIADDPKASAAGEVLPSDWNANHSVAGTVDSSVGARALLTANTSYYVSTTGSDSNGGTNSTTDAWATLQHAMNFIASKIDIAGFGITINCGAGTFVGFGVPSMVGGGYIQVNGAGSASTIWQDGPNDGVINDLSVVSVLQLTDTIISFNKVTLQSPTAGNAYLEVGVNLPQVWLGDFPTLGGTAADIVFDSSIASGGGGLGIFGFNGAFINSLAGAYSIQGDNWAQGGGLGFGFMTVTNLSQLVPRGTWTIVGSPNMNLAVATQNSFINGGAFSNVLGSYTGFAGVAVLNSCLREFGINTFVNNKTVIVDASSSNSIDSNGLRAAQPFPMTVSQLNTNFAASNGQQGARMFVTDSNTSFAAGLGNVVVASTSTSTSFAVPVYSDGTNWIIG